MPGVPVGSVALHDGFWAPRRRALAEVGLPSLLARLDEHGVLDAFRRLAGADVARRGLWFTDSDLYKWMEAAAWAGRLDLLDPVVELVAAAQQPDGYLNTWYVGDRAASRYGDLAGSHELYCAGHLFEAAVAHHRVTADPRLLDVAVRLADHLVREFGPGGRPGVDGHPEVELALVELARETGDDRYVALAASFCERAGGLELGELWGHAVRMLYLATGIADVAAETGDERFAAAADRLWASLVGTRSYVTGGVGGRWLGEAVGRPYELPAEAAYAESCAAVAAARWAWRRLVVTGDVRAADHLETVLHNAVAAAVSLGGDEWFYANALASAAEGEADPWASPYDFQARAMLEWHPPHRRGWFDVTCCPPNVSRLLASLPGMLYGQAGDDLWVHLWVASSVEHGGWSVRVDGGLPWQGHARLTVQRAPEGEAALRLRMPGWCTDPSVRAAGAPVAVDGPGHVEVRRRWAAGDEVEIDLPLEPTLLAAHPRVADARGAVALRRGPLVYCFEQVDNPGVALLEAAIDPAVAFTAEHDPGLLGGVTVLSGAGWSPDPDHRLYRPHSSGAGAGAGPGRTPVRLRAVPYAVWANRGVGPMAVWLACP
ncbi:MAG: glycoside hydrolase family 127 protein [Acidimicrobiales bacterium]|nr:glycoside hydrolase family 127 protein [Acidimicrobiales bacterium]